MSFGAPGTRGSPYINTVEQANQVLDAFQKHAHVELDCSRQYGEGTTEELLGEVGWQSRGLTMGTKLYPSAGNPLEKTAGYTHAPEDVRRGMLDSLKALKSEKIDLFYLHGPDRKHPYEDTLRTLNELQLEGSFKRWGISNFMAWEVAHMCEICDRHGWVKPSVYQGHYHALHRCVEDELVSLPEALRDRPRGDEIGNLHLKYGWNEGYWDALDIILSAAEKLSMSIPEMALRWLVHHSALRVESGDAVIVGAGTVKNLENNLVDLEKGQLSDEAVEALGKAWKACKATAPKYFH
ncbi:aldo/keto reductase [Xylariaceae sp. FL0016]|nr:aldo/keto reductase [Xylariaceae sp. FL0016]